MITKEDFEAWRDNPVTTAIFAVLDRIADGAKDEWAAATWNDKPLDETTMILRANLKAKEETISDLTTLTFEEFDSRWQQPQNSE